MSLVIWQTLPAAGMFDCTGCDLKGEHTSECISVNTRLSKVKGDGGYPCACRAPVRGPYSQILRRVP